MAARAALPWHICTLQIGTRSPIPACPPPTQPRRRLRGLPGAPAHGPNTFQTEGRAVDGRLACADADHDDRRPRDDARTQRVSDHGGALDPRRLHAVSAGPPPRRVRGDEDVAAAAACRAQSHSLRRPARLVLRADADPARPVVSIEFTMPIGTAILAASFLGERITAGKIAAIVLGVVGVLIIVRPAAGEINPGPLIALGAAIGFGISIAMMKSLTRTENTLTIIFWMLVIQSAAGFFPALYVWIWASAYAFGWIVVSAFCGAFCHYCMARAMLYADATVVLPMDFLRVPLTATAGWLIYAEPLDKFTVLGAGLILTGNLLNLRAVDPVPARAAS